MLAPKSAHLVERAAERLRQSGVLEGSAAQLLEPGRAGPPPPLPPQPQPQPRPEPAIGPPAAVSEGSVGLLAPEAPGRELQEAPEPASPRTGRIVIDMARLERAGLFDWTRGRSRISEEF